MQHNTRDKIAQERGKGKTENGKRRTENGERRHETCNSDTSLIVNLHSVLSGTQVLSLLPDACSLFNSMNSINSKFFMNLLHVELTLIQENPFVQFAFTRITPFLLNLQNDKKRNHSTDKTFVTAIKCKQSYPFRVLC